MTAYHATHESPYADDCPDCAGYPDPIEETRRTLGRLGPVLILVAFVLAALYVVIGGNRS